jgi:WD40 repeat protein
MRDAPGDDDPGRSATTGRTAPVERAEVGFTLADEEASPSALVTGQAGRSPAAADEQVVTPDRYEMGAEIARGGIGRISRALDRRLHRVVAIKELRRDDPAAVARFLRETRITAELSHPNIIPLHEAGRWPNGQPFYAMKLVDGRTFARAISEAKTLRERLALLPVLVDVAEAMAYAHSRGIVHRDLKPSNVLVGPFGETVVIDWGLAKHVDETEGLDEAPATVSAPLPGETSVGVVVGTPAYMPPEQAAGLPIASTADVYAMGAMLYHLVSGHIPYAEYPSDELVARVREGAPTALAQVAPGAPRDLVAIVDKSMARRSGDRYPTGREMAEELRLFATGGLVGAYRYGLWELVERFFDRQRAVVITLAISGLALAMFGGVSVARIATERDRAQRSAAAETTARSEAERRVDELLVEKARALLDRDPTRSVAWLKRPRTSPPGAATIAAWAEERGVAEQVLRGHQGQVTTVAYSPDGKRLATGGDDKRVVLWNAETGLAIELPGHTDRVTKVTFSPDGAILASASYDTTIRLYGTDGRLVRALTGHRAPVKWIAFSGDSRRLCSIATDGDMRVWDPAGDTSQSYRGAGDRNMFCAFSPDGSILVSGNHGGALHLLSLSTGQIRVLDGHGGAVRSAAFSPDGKTIAAGSDDGDVRLWPAVAVDARAPRGGTAAPNGGIPRRLAGDGSVIQNVVFSPDGTSLAAAGMSGRVRLWNLQTGTFRVVSEHGERVAALAFSRDGRYLASSGWDKLVRVHDLRTEVNTLLRGHGDVVVALSFSPDGAHLASASWDKTVRLWSAHHTHERRVLKGHTVGVHTVAFSPDGKLVASGGHDDMVRLFRVDTGESRLFAGHGDHVFRVLFSPDGKLLASSSDDQTVRVWGTNGESVRVLSGHRDDVEELAFSPDGKRLASASKDNTARLWSLDGSPPVVLEHDHDVTGVAFDDRGETLATSSRDGTVRLWNGHSGVPLRVLRGHADEVSAVTFSPDGKRLASAGADDAVIVWDAASEARKKLSPLSGARIVKFSPDGSRLAVAGAAPMLWICDVAREACTELRGHEAVIHDLAFLPDSRGLVTASGDGTVQIWDLETLERRVLEGHAAPVFGIAVSADGRTAASGSGDADVRLWAIVRPPRPADLRAFLDGLSHEQLAPGIQNPAAEE